MSIRDGKPYDFTKGTVAYVLKEFEPGIRAIYERDPNKWEDHVGHFDSAEVIPLVDTASRPVSYTHLTLPTILLV